MEFGREGGLGHVRQAAEGEKGDSRWMKYKHRTLDNWSTVHRDVICY